MRGKTAEPVAPVVVCSHCGRAGLEDEVGEFCGENFCRGVLQAVVVDMDPKPDHDLERPERPVRVPRREKEREGYARAFLFMAVIVLALVVVATVFWPSKKTEPPTAGDAVSVGTAPSAKEQMSEKEMPPDSAKSAEEKPAENPEPEDGMGMADSGAADDHTRSLRQAAHQFVNGYLAWSYGVWRSPPGLFAAGEAGAAYVHVEQASGWAGKPVERPEVAGFETERKRPDLASAHVVAGAHVVDLVLQRHTSGSMENWLGIRVTHHMRPIWRVTTVVDANA